MLSNRIAGYSKPIAWFFAFLFYSQFVIAAVTLRVGEEIPRFARNDSRKFEPLTVNEPEAIKATSEINSPKQKFTTGPTQPEMQSYQSVNANNMVDLFSGD